MRKNLVYRPFMMTLGILAVVVILLSHTFYKETQNPNEEARTEQSDSDAPKTFVSVPADAVTSSPVAEVNEQVPALLEEFEMHDAGTESVVLASPVLTRLVKTLFRVIISPNAP